MRFFLIFSVLVMLGGQDAIAQDLSMLERGLYNPEDAGCENIGNAGTMQFDGNNFNGHYQLCLTEHINGDDYQSTCIEVQGEDYKKSHDILHDPDREINKFKLKILSNHSFKINNVQYKYCMGM